MGRGDAFVCKLLMAGLRWAAWADRAMDLIQHFARDRLEHAARSRMASGAPRRPVAQRMSGNMYTPLPAHLMFNSATTGATFSGAASCGTVGASLSPLVCDLLELGVSRCRALRAERLHPHDAAAAAAWAFDEASPPARAAQRQRISGAPVAPWRPGDPLSNTQSWFLMPVLRAGAGMAACPDEQAWREHPLTADWWPTVVEILKAADPVAGSEILARARRRITSSQLAPEGRRRCEAAYNRLAHVVAGTDAVRLVSLRACVANLADAGGYIEGILQEELLSEFGGVDMVQQLVLRAAGIAAAVRSFVDVPALPPSATAAATVVNLCAEATCTSPVAADRSGQAFPPVTAHAGGPCAEAPPTSGRPYGSAVAAAGVEATVLPFASASTLTSAGSAAALDGSEASIDPGSQSRTANAALPFAAVNTRTSDGRAAALDSSEANSDPGSHNRTADALGRFWNARRAAVDAEVERMYAAHRASRDPYVVVEALRALPIFWPVQPRDFGLTMEQVFNNELALYEEFCHQTNTTRFTIQQQYDARLDYVRLCPFFLAVICSFVDRTGTPPEMLFGFAHSMAGWTLHKEAHARLWELLDRRTRPRAYIQIIGDSDIGKSPFFDDFCQPWFDLVASPPFSELFASGGRKGLVFAQTSAAELGERIKACDGQPIWATPENLLVQDTAFAMGRANEKSQQKGDVHQLLETVNGGAFGPTSIKSAKEQVFIRRTNIGWFHMGQPRVVHDFYGQAFEQKGNLRGIGLETRPWFLFTASEFDGTADTPLVSAEPTSLFLRSLLVVLACTMGHSRDSAEILEQPLRAGATDATRSQHMWNSFHKVARESKEYVHRAGKQAVGKHGYTTGTFIVNNHFLLAAFGRLHGWRGDVRQLLQGDPATLAGLLASPEGGRMGGWSTLSDEALSGAPAHLQHMVAGVLTVFGEMTLPPEQRAGPPLASAVRRPLQRTHSDEDQTQRSNDAAVYLSNDEALIKRALDRAKHRGVLKVTDMNAVRSSLRGNHVEICRLFDVAARLRIGVREGEAPPALRQGVAYVLSLRLTLEAMTLHDQRRFGIVEARHAPAAAGEDSGRSDGATIRAHRMSGAGIETDGADVDVQGGKAAQWAALTAIARKWRLFDTPEYFEDRAQHYESATQAMATCGLHDCGDADSAALMLANYFGRAYPILTAALRGDASLLHDRVSTVAAAGSKRLLDAHSQGFDEDVATFCRTLPLLAPPLFRKVKAAMPCVSEGAPWFRGLHFATETDMQEYITNAPERFAAGAHESFTTDLSVALTFTYERANSVDDAIACMRKGAGARLRKNNASSHRLLCIGAGVPLAGVSSLNPMSDHEAEVWVARPASVKVALITRRQHELKAYLTCHETTLHGLGDPSLRNSLCTAVADTQLCVAVIAPDGGVHANAAGSQPCGSAGPAAPIGDGARQCSRADGLGGSFETTEAVDVGGKTRGQRPLWRCLTPSDGGGVVHGGTLARRPACVDASASPRRGADTGRGADSSGRLSEDELIIKDALARVKGKGAVSVTDMNAVRSKLRGDQNEIKRLFDIAESLNIGARRGEARSNTGQGSAANQSSHPLSLELTLARMSRADQQRFKVGKTSSSERKSSKTETVCATLDQASSRAPATLQTEVHEPTRSELIQQPQREGGGCDATQSTREKHAGSSLVCSSDGENNEVEIVAMDMESAQVAESVQLGRAVIRDIQERDDLVDGLLHSVGKLRAPVDGDGDCQFAAVVESCKAARDEGKLDVSVDPGDKRALRDNVVEHMRQNPVAYRPFVERNEGWEDCLARLLADGQWGEGITLRAIADYLRLIITLVHPDANVVDYHLQPRCPRGELLNELGRIELAWDGQRHFDGVRGESHCEVVQRAVTHPAKRSSPRVHAPRDSGTKRDGGRGNLHSRPLCAPVQPPAQPLSSKEYRHGRRQHDIRELANT